MITPKNGFYYHYKHEPDGPLHNYTHEVLGVAHHTEEEGANFVIYRPLGEDSPAWQKGKLFYARPLEMFLEEVEKGGRRLPRFTHITDPQLIEKLIEKRSAMYG